MESNKPNKEPWIALAMSFMFPGLGQLYAGRIIRGLVIMFTYLTLSFSSLYLFMYSDVKPAVTIPMLHLSVTVWVMAVIDAHKIARKGNDPDFEANRKSKRDPFLAIFLGFIFPGFGHLYLRSWIAAIIFFAVYFIIPGWLYLGPPYVEPACLIMEIFFTLAVCTHIWRISHRSRQIRLRPAMLLAVLSLAVTISIQLATAYFAFNICQVFTVPKSIGMHPTLLSGDRFIVDKTAWYSYERGDVLVYMSPEDYEVNLIQRVIAFENETVEIDNSGIYINGRKTDFPSIKTQDTIKRKSLYASKNNPYTVPEGHIFLVGDNFNVSFDSRHFGAIDEYDVIGVAHKIIWPISRTKILK